MRRRLTRRSARRSWRAIRATSPRHLDGELAKLYELIWTRTIASQMESAELERTTVDILGEAGKRRLDLRASGQVVRFDGFLKLYQEGRDDDADDEDSNRLPPMKTGEALAKDKIETTQHFTEPPPRYTEATLVKRMEELGIGRPSTYASTLAVLRERDYVRIEKKRLVPEDKGRLVTAFLESFFAKYVSYDFTADLEERLDKVADAELEWTDLLKQFWKDFSGALGETADLRTTQVLDSLNDLLGPHIFPAKADGSDPRGCPSCGKGQLSLKLGKFGAFIGCSNYPECRYTRVLAPNAEANGEARPGVRVLGQDPDNGDEITLRTGRFGDYVQRGEGEKPKRCSLPKGLAPADVTLEKAIALLALPREVAKHPTSGEPIVAGIGRFGSYVQHGKTYANLGREDDVLEVGGNRAIDLIVAKESGAGQPRFGQNAGRGAGRSSDRGWRDHACAAAVSAPMSITARSMRRCRATCRRSPSRSKTPWRCSRRRRLAAAARRAGALVGDHPDGGSITVRPGRFGAYVNWGKVNATIPKSIAPESVTLADALELIEERQARPELGRDEETRGQAIDEGEGQGSGGREDQGKAVARAGRQGKAQSQAEGGGRKAGAGGDQEESKGLRQIWRSLGSDIK